MRKRLFFIASFLLLALSTFYPSKALAFGVSCVSPQVTAPMGGGVVIANVDCTISTLGLLLLPKLSPTEGNLMLPSSLPLYNGVNTINAMLLSPVVSPDASVTSISGTSSGFTANLPVVPTSGKIRFQYSITTTSATPAGTYTAAGGTEYYQYAACSSLACGLLAGSGSAAATTSVIVPAIPVSVSCSSSSANAPGGGGNYALTVVCTAVGNSGAAFSPNASNRFLPNSLTLSNGSSTLTAILGSIVSSPDGTVTGISGTSSGFTGNIISFPAKVQVQYTGSTTSGTKAGTYTSPPVTFTWSTL